MDVYNTRVKKNDERFQLFIISNLIGLGILGYLLFSRIFSEILNAFYVAVYDTKGYDAYIVLINSSVFNNLVYLVYAVFCVVLPLVIVHLISVRIFHYNLPYGKIRKGSSFVPAMLIGLGMSVHGNYVSLIFSSITKNLFQATPTGSPSDVTSVSQISFVGFLVSVVSTAVMPALAEEFAIRGVIMQPLRRYGDRFAIVISAAVFSLIHGNFEQIPFAFVVGLALGYVVIRTGSLWTGVVLHFINNFWAVCSEYLYYLLPDEVYAVCYFGANLAICIAAVIAAVYLYKKDAKDGVSDSILEKPKCTISIFQKSLLVVYSPTFLVGAWLLIDSALQQFIRV